MVPKIRISLITTVLLSATSVAVYGSASNSSNVYKITNLVAPTAQINLAQYNNQALPGAVNFQSTPDELTLLRLLNEANWIQTDYVNEITINDIGVGGNHFTLTARSWSPHYIGTALINYSMLSNTDLDTIITTDTLSNTINGDLWSDSQSANQVIMKGLKTQFPTINLNQIKIENLIASDFKSGSGSFKVSPVNDQSMYTGVKILNFNFKPYLQYIITAQKFDTVLYSSTPTETQLQNDLVLAYPALKKDQIQVTNITDSGDFTVSPSANSFYAGTDVPMTWVEPVPIDSSFFTHNGSEITGLQNINSIPNDVNVLEIPYQIGADVITSIGEGAFVDTHAYNGSTIVPSQITKIDFSQATACIEIKQGAFYKSPCTTIDLGNVTTLTSDAFSGASLNMSLQFADSNLRVFDSGNIQSIPIAAFRGSKLVNITINSNLNSIASWAFLVMPNVTSINVDSSNPNFGVYDFTSSQVGHTGEIIGSILCSKNNGQLTPLGQNLNLVNGFIDLSDTLFPGNFLGQYCLAEADSLSSCYLNDYTTQINRYSLQCSNMMTLVLDKSTKITIGSDNPFTSQMNNLYPIDSTGRIYIGNGSGNNDDALLSSYKASFQSRGWPRAGFDYTIDNRALFWPISMWTRP